MLNRKQLLVLWLLIGVTALGLALAATVWRQGGIALFGIGGFLTCAVGWQWTVGRRK
jgi:hypothetical protein